MADWEERGTQRPLHKESIHVERKRGMSWSWLLLPIVALGLLALMFMPRHDYRTQQASTTTTQVATTQNHEITYGNRRWEVRGAAQTFPDGQLRQIGTSDQGDVLYANPQQGYNGGGGGGAADGTSADETAADGTTSAQTSGPVYLRNADGTFQPLFARQ